LIAHLGVRPVHLVGQDIAGAAVFRLAATHPHDVLSFVAIEMGLPGFGLQALADVTQGGTDRDVLEFARRYSRPNGWRGASGLYRAMLQEGPEIRELARSQGLTMPVLAIGAGGVLVTADTLAQVSRSEVRTVTLEGVGHYAAMEAARDVAEAIINFTIRLGSI
jgi:pimeloyl-ACP methyl ester carboxylesterase